MARILVVDDEEGVREFVAEALESDEHAVDKAASAEQALVALGKHQYELMITDLKMPGMDGLALLTRAQEIMPEIQTIVLTAHGSVDSAVEAMKRGAFDFVQKPVSSPSELRLLAARALERRSLLALKESQSRASESELRLSYDDPAMKPVLEALTKVARTTATVLFLGESGTGKEVAARELHRLSGRSDGPFMAVNCAALSEHLLESELFGHEKGAFTGAVAARRGRLELAQGGSFFLDEVGELKPELQAKLLRVLQERSFERIGGTRTIAADVRWVAATNRELSSMVSEGKFREDLYHRLAVFPIRMPPLRERRGDIPGLARDLLLTVGRSVGKPGLGLDESALALLRQSRWPGNIRELRNVLERAAILADAEQISAEHLVLESSMRPAEGFEGTLEDIERRAIEQTLASVGGNRKQAADKLGIGLRTLYDKLKRWGIG